MNVKNKKILRLRPMAAKLGVMPSWLLEQAEEGQIPSFKAGNRYLFNSDVVEKIIAKRAAKGGNDE